MDFSNTVLTVTDAKQAPKLSTTSRRAARIKTR